MMIRSRFITIFIAVGMIFLVRSAAAESETGLRRLLRARTSSQLRRILAEDQNLRRARLVCDGELRGSRVPEACFEAISLTKVRNDSAWTEFDGEKKDERWLEDLCITRVEASRDWKELSLASRNRRLPARCREAAIKRRDDLAYSDQSERPAEIFARHFSSDD